MHAVYLLGRVRASLQFASPARGEMRDGRLHVVASRVHAFGAEAVHSPQPSAGTRRAAAALEQPQQAAGLRSHRQATCPGDTLRVSQSSCVTVPVIES